MGSISRFPANTIYEVEGEAEVEDDVGGENSPKEDLSRSRRNTMARIVAAASYALRLW
ncbi:hypothetical protein WN51_13841 [Melipona quadrifasciata]|uniref:Uncharacterized protein n=1 Tax=Melipona quadrifasciata TaxID=166423 RepID=A0A0M9A158_9HYME|nr:hypothetical protein WN51_13841 [Melipona quadrifasciata]